jgi:erythromycin esterase
MKTEGKQFAVAKRFILHPSSFILVVFIALNLGAATIESPAMWLRTHALPLASVEPSADDSDLAPFLSFFANAHIVALGDATHGTHEFFSVKQRLIRLLVKHANVRTIAFEAPYGEFEAIRDYVRTGAGDPAALLRNDDYFFWNTDEVLDTIRWVRAWNAAGNPPVDIVGVDAYHTKTTIARLLTQLDPSTRAEAARAYGCVGRFTKREECHAAVMGVRPMLQARRVPAEAIYAARLVEEGEESLNRDAAMAENIEQLAEREGAGNLVVWGHNEHFGRNYRSAGETLAMRYGAAYIAIGTMALRGSFNAVEFVGDNMVISHFALDDASPDDYAASFTAASLPRMIVPLRGPLPTWLSAPRPMRIAGSNVISHHETTVTLTEDLAKSFDAVIYIEATTPSRLRQ